MWRDSLRDAGGSLPLRGSSRSQEFPENYHSKKKIMSVQYKIPDYVHISQDCKQLLSRIFVASPARRITIGEIKKHPWFLKNLPRELTETAQGVYYKRDTSGLTYSLQSAEEIMKIVGEARTPPPSSRSVPGFGWAEEEEDDDEEEEVVENAEGDDDKDEDDDEYDKRVKEVHASGEFKIS